MSDLPEFLLARIAEDEEIARAEPDDPYVVQRMTEARMLAECAAKRQIVGLCRPGDWTRPHYHPSGEPGERDRGDVLELLALPYADHPDYDEAWRP